MKKIIKIILFIVIPVSAVILYMLYTEKMIIRLPVLVNENPKITFATGDVKFREAEDKNWQVAVVGRTLKMGYEIKTEEDSLADLRFTDDMAIRISANSLLKLDVLTIKKMLLNVKKGSMYGKFEKIYKNHKINIKTPTVVASVRGTELGFELSSIKKEAPADKEAEKEKTDEKKPGKEKAAAEKDEKTEKEIPETPAEEFTTTVFSISGITELQNPKFDNHKVLLSYQNKLQINENNPPGDIESLTDDEVLRLRSILNSIHTEEVLIISDKITFKSGSAKILKISYPELNKIYKLLWERNVRIRIEGHTDSFGSDASNQELSLKRAIAIKEYIFTKGIQREKMETAGYGESRPIADNKTKKGRAKNRRVEFIIIDK